MIDTALGQGIDVLDIIATFLKFSFFLFFGNEKGFFCRFELIFGSIFRPGHHPGQTLLAINLYTLLTIVQSGVKIPFFFD